MSTQHTLKTSVEVARLIRDDIKQAAGNGSLGDLPDGVRFSVTAPKMGLARPVVISIQNAPREWTHDASGKCAVSDAARSLAWSLRDLLVRYGQAGRVDLDGLIQCGW
jgi:hypothetical protein